MGLKENQARYYAKKREFIILVKSVPCLDCGVTYPHYVMDFDHCRGVKSFTISEKLGSYSLSRIVEEIKKCDVICSNCHRERTYRN